MYANKTKRKLKKSSKCLTLICKQKIGSSMNIKDNNQHERMEKKLKINNRINCFRTYFLKNSHNHN